MKTVFRILLSLGFLLILGAVILTFSIGTILKSQIEKHGSEILGTSVQVSSVRALPFSKQLSVYGLEIENPKGFSDNPALKLDEVRIQLLEGGVFSENIVINYIHIINPNIHSELSVKGSNLSMLRNNIDRYASQPSEMKNTNAEKTGGDEVGRRVIIRTLKVVDGKITVAGDVTNIVKQATGLAAEKITTLDIPELVIKNIGEKQGGVSVSQASFEIFSRLMKSVQIVDRSVLKGAAEDIQNQLQMLMP